MTEREIIDGICIKADCNMRCPLNKPSRLRLSLGIIIKTLNAIMVGMLFGCVITGFLATHVKAQPQPMMSRYDAVTVTTNIAVLSNEVHGLKDSVRDLSNKVDKIQSQADITQATGAGIGLAITFLQLLGLIVNKSKDNKQ